MKLKDWFAFVGSLGGVGGAAALYFLAGVSWLGLAVLAGGSILFYIVAAIGSSSQTNTTGFGELMRGFLIGLNAGLNGIVAYLVSAVLVSAGAAVGIAAAVGVLCYLSVFGPISQSEVYQGFLGWLTWVMPMSWLIVALGLLFLVFSFLLSLVTLFQVPYLRLTGLRVEWKTGTIFVKGGLVANLNYLDTAFNMGNFSFVDAKSSSWHMEHEAGHTLNLSAFGSFFHLLGAVDENILPGRGANAYAERLADSNVPSSSASNIPMWS
jgi:hypothetical protein